MWSVAITNWAMHEHKLRDQYTFKETSVGTRASHGFFSQEGG
jgi:hypothetical protein